MTNLCLDYGRAKAASGAPAAAVAAPSSSRAKCNGGTPAEDEPLHPPPLRPKQKGGSPAAPSVLRFRGEGISAISADLAPLAGSLRRLELPYNDLSSGKPLAGLAALPGLTYLDLSGNRLRDLAGVQVCENLTVLNVSHNKIKDISHHVLSCKKLKALVANDNEIASAELVSKLSELSTIVLSRNKLTKLPSLFELNQLKKIAAAHNALTEIPNLRGCGRHLCELRLNNNAITSVPDFLPEVAPNLEIIDLGSNRIKNWREVFPLGSMPKLTNLNLKGNAICNREKYREKIVQLIPSLRILDGERFDPRFQERKAKQKARLELIDRIEQQKAGLRIRKNSEDRKRFRAELDAGEAEGVGRSARKPCSLDESEQGVAAQSAPLKHGSLEKKRGACNAPGDGTPPGKKAKVGRDGGAALPREAGQLRRKDPPERELMFSKADLQASSSVGPRRGRADAEFAAAVAAALATVPMGFKKAKRDAKRLAQMADAAGVGAEAAPSIAELTGKVGAKESAGGRENVATGCTMAASPGTAVGPSENERGESKAASATPSTGQRDTFFDFADGAEVDGEKRPANWGSVNSVAKGTKTDAASSPRPGHGRKRHEPQKRPRTGAEAAAVLSEKTEKTDAPGASPTAPSSRRERGSITDKPGKRKIELSTPKAPPTPPTPPSAASTSKPGLGPAVGDGAGEDAAARRREQTGVVAVLIHKPQKQNHHEHHKHGQGHGHQRRRGRAHEPTSRSLLQKFAAGQADDPSAIEKLFATAGSAAVAGGGLEIGEGIGGAWD